MNSGGPIRLSLPPPDRRASTPDGLIVGYRCPSHASLLPAEPELPGGRLPPCYQSHRRTVVRGRAPAIRQRLRRGQTVMRPRRDPSRGAASPKPIGATGFEPATFRPPAEGLVGVDASRSVLRVPIVPARWSGLDALDASVGTKAVPVRFRPPRPCRSESGCHRCAVRTNRNDYRKPGGRVGRLQGERPHRSSRARAAGASPCAHSVLM